MEWTEFFERQTDLLMTSDFCKFDFDIDSTLYDLVQKKTDSVIFPVPPSAIDAKALTNMKLDKVEFKEYPICTVSPAAIDAEALTNMKVDTDGVFPSTVIPAKRKWK